jgi:hypothetical protein
LHQQFNEDRQQMENKLKITILFIKVPAFGAVGQAIK